MAASPTTGLLFNIVRFATHDGPGIRTCVFFKGCPLDCWWCHNPESQSFLPDRLYFDDRCRLCLDCVDACPEHAISPSNGGVTTSGACTLCGTCPGICVAEARQIAGRRYALPELLDEIERDLPFFDESGGGVTLTGGEPVSQPDFAAALLDACRDRGIRTALETCGFAQPANFLRVAMRAGLVLFDLKFVDADKHRRYTGVANQLILANLKDLLASGIPAAVRIPVVPGVNDTPDDVARFADCLRSLRAPAVELLPYHRTGTDKYRRLGRSYRLPGTLQPAPADLARFREVLSRAGVPVTIRGES